MKRMIRKQVYIEAQQEELLKRRSRELGISEAALIRRGIELAGERIVSLPRELRAWDEARQLIEKRMGIDAPQTGRSWTREELYEERLERLSG